METRPFPANCKMRIMCHFPDSPDVNGPGKMKDWNRYTERTKATWEREIRDFVKRNIDHFRLSGQVLVATTTGTQIITNKVLRELGFRRTVWMETSKSKAYPERKVRFWYLELEKLKKQEGNNQGG